MVLQAEQGHKILVQKLKAMVAQVVFWVKIEPVEGKNPTRRQTIDFFEMAKRVLYEDELWMYSSLAIVEIGFSR